MRKKRCSLCNSKSWTSTHYFDDRALTGYALKLKLLERKSCFDQKKGKAELDRILDGLQKQILLEEQG